MITRRFFPERSANSLPPLPRPSPLTLSLRRCRPRRDSCDGEKCYCGKPSSASASKASPLFSQGLRKLNIACIVAPYEADAQLAYLCMIGYCHAVLTEGAFPSLASHARLSSPTLRRPQTQTCLCIAQCAGCPSLSSTSSIKQGSYTVSICEL